MKHLVTLFAVALLSTACSGFNSGLPSGTAMQDLSNAQVLQFCERSLDYLNRRLDQRTRQRVQCYYTGMGAASGASDPQGACQDAFDSCMNEDPDEIHFECDDSPMPCTATVAEVEQCIQDTVRASNDFFKTVADGLSFSCDPAQFESDVRALQVDLEEPASCLAVDETCDSDWESGWESESDWD